MQCRRRPNAWEEKREEKSLQPTKRVFQSNEEKTEEAAKPSKQNGAKTIEKGGSVVYWEEKKRQGTP